MIQDHSTCAVCQQPLTEKVGLGQLIAHKVCRDYISKNVALAYKAGQEHAKLFVEFPQDSA